MYNTTVIVLLCTLGNKHDKYLDVIVQYWKVKH